MTNTHEYRANYIVNFVQKKQNNEADIALLSRVINTLLVSTNIVKTVLLFSKSWKRTYISMWISIEANK